MPAADSTSRGKSADPDADFVWRVRPEAMADGAQTDRRRAGTGVRTPPPQAVRYLVRVRGTLAGEPFERSAGGIFYLHQPGGRLLPDGLNVQRVGGDLVLNAEAVIQRPGSYWAYAELWGEDGQRPVAFARERLANLSAGRHAIRLLFGGLVIRDSRVDGPYVVRNLRFQQVDTHPPHEATTPDERLLPTPPWKATDFN